MFRDEECYVIHLYLVHIGKRCTPCRKRCLPDSATAPEVESFDLLDSDSPPYSLVKLPLSAGQLTENPDCPYNLR
jgi:hypothetical protein